MKILVGNVGKYNHDKKGVFKISKAHTIKQKMCLIRLCKIKNLCSK